MILCFAPCILVGPAVVGIVFVARRTPFPFSTQIFQGLLLLCLATVPVSLAFGFRYVARSITHPILRYLFLLLWIVGGSAICYLTQFVAFSVLLAPTGLYEMP